MRVTKNPRLKHRAEVDMVVTLSDINVNHRCRLLYVLYMNSKYHFYRKKMQEFLNKCDEYAEYILENRDQELLEYRFEKLLKDTPYINQEKAELILDCQEGFATDAERPLYIEPNCRDDMIACIMLALIVLHHEYNFHEDRINRVATEWAHCGITNPGAWVEKHLKIRLNYSDREYITDWLDKSAPRKQRTTLQEQKVAKQGLEAFRRWTEENTEGVV